MKTEYWCISIDSPEFEERRKRFNFFSKINGWDIKFWNAVDCRNLYVEDYPIWSALHLKPGEVGIWWSTKELFEHASEKDLDFLYVFEDDAKIISSDGKIGYEELDFVFFNDRKYGFEGYRVSKNGIKKFLKVLSQQRGARCPIDIFVRGEIKDKVKYSTIFKNIALEPMLKYDTIFPSSIQETKCQKKS